MSISAKLGCGSPRQAPVCSNVKSSCVQCRERSTGFSAQQRPRSLSPWATVSVGSGPLLPGGAVPTPTTSSPPHPHTLHPSPLTLTHSHRYNFTCVYTCSYTYMYMYIYMHDLACICSVIHVHACIYTIFSSILLLCFCCTCIAYNLCVLLYMYNIMYST